MLRTGHRKHAVLSAGCPHFTNATPSEEGNTQGEALPGIGGNPRTLTPDILVQQEAPPLFPSPHLIWGLNKLKPRGKRYLSVGPKHLPCGLLQTHHGRGGSRVRAPADSMVRSLSWSTEPLQSPVAQTPGFTLHPHPSCSLSGMRDGRLLASDPSWGRGAQAALTSLSHPESQHLMLGDLCSQSLPRDPLYGGGSCMGGGCWAGAWLEW